MSILRRAIVMLIVAGVLSSDADVFAKGPRTLLNATLKPTAAGPAVAKGKAKFDQSASRTNFSVEAENLRGLNGLTASFFVNGTQVHTLAITEPGWGQTLFPAIALRIAHVEVQPNPDFPTF